MKYRMLGKSGLRVSELCLGTATFGEEWGFGSAKEECSKMFDAFAEEGGNFIDTADHYGDGTSEKWLGEFIHTERDRYVIATKYTLGNLVKPLRPGDPNSTGNHRKHMMEVVEACLKRLNTDYIDLLYIHVWDFLTPIEEILRGLDDLVRAGKICYAGISNTPAYIVSRANTIAELRGWTSFISYEGMYNLLDRSIEREIVPMAHYLDMAICCWCPLANAFLSGSEEEIKIRVDSGITPKPTDAQWAVIKLVGAIAKQVGCSPSQVAYNWLRQQLGVVIPIVAGRKVDHMKDDLACLRWSLSAEHMQHLNEATQIDMGYPMSILPTLAGMTYNKMLDKIEARGTLPAYFGRQSSE